LRLEDAQTGLAEKERLNNDLQQEKAALKVQVGKWKSLDDRDEAQVEELHKQRAALEGQIKRLESRLAEEQSKVSAHENASQKEHRKIEKLQKALEEQSVRTRVEFPGSTFTSLSYSVLLKRQKLQRKRTTTVMEIPR
jgi:predicted  nucleic acid-binding Zn-ribbon protein